MRAPFPGYSIARMSYHGTATFADAAEEAVDERETIANDEAEDREADEREDEDE